jgi:hypothetical protein
LIASGFFFWRLFGAGGLVWKIGAGDKRNARRDDRQFPFGAAGLNQRASPLARRVAALTFPYVDHFSREPNPNS